MTDHILTLVVALVGAGGVGSFVTVIVNRRKTNVEADALAGKSWQEYAKQMKDDYDQLRGEFNEMGKKLAGYEATIEAKNKHIETLERLLTNRNPDLERTLKSIEAFMGGILRIMQSQGITIPLTPGGEVDLGKSL